MWDLCKCAIVPAALFLLLGCSQNTPQPAKQPEPSPDASSTKTVPENVVEAWKKRGADLWVVDITTNEDLTDTLPFTGKLVSRQIPAFEFKKNTEPDLSNLPPVPVPFAISLAFTKVKDDDLKHLTAVKNLKRLLLTNTPITDKAIPHLVQLKELTHLRLDGTRLSRKVDAKIKEGLPDCHIEH